tara:strand:+ start:3532 stop:5325 length:1794 start_codon:yes stop_codon:yes gene_type:complete
MRIPTYRAQGQITTQAPGASFTARKNPNPFVKQAVAKGDMQAELFSQAASYAATQRKIKVEARKNEAILGAKEAMLQLSDAFLNDNQPYDIFEPDGTGRWDQETKDIKNKLRSKIGTDRYALAAFDTAFAQAELPLRFQLKGQIDTKIEKMHVASVNEGWEDFVFKYGSDPYVNTTTFDIDFAAEKEKTSKAVELGAFEKDVMSELPNNVLKRIATDLMPAYAGRDMAKANTLFHAFDAIQNGTFDAENFEEIPPHVLNVLQKVSPSDGQKIITATLKSAASIAKIQRDLDAKSETIFNDNVNAIYNRYFYYRTENNKTDFFNLNELRSIFPNIQVLGIQKDKDGNEIAPGYRMAEAIKNHLAGLNELTFEMRNQIKAFDADKKPERQDDMEVIDMLNAKEAFDDLSVNDVLEVSNRLSSASLLKFTEKAQRDSEKGEVDAKSNIRNALRYQTSEFISAEIDEDLALRVTNQIDDIYTKLDDAIRTAIENKKPLTKLEIQNKGLELLVEIAPRFSEVITEQFVETLSFAATRVDQFNSIKTELLSSSNPREASAILETWYNSLSNATDLETKRYSQYKRSFLELANKLDAINNVNRP